MTRRDIESFCDEVTGSGEKLLDAVGRFKTSETRSLRGFQRATQRLKVFRVNPASVNDSSSRISFSTPSRTSPNAPAASAPEASSARPNSKTMNCRYCNCADGSSPSCPRRDAISPCCSASAALPSISLKSPASRAETRFSKSDNEIIHSSIGCVATPMVRRRTSGVYRCAISFVLRVLPFRIVRVPQAASPAATSQAATSTEEAA